MWSIIASLIKQDNSVTDVSVREPSGSRESSQRITVPLFFIGDANTPNVMGRAKLCRQRKVVGVAMSFFCICIGSAGFHKICTGPPFITGEMHATLLH